jgi:hypothetical protein
MSSASYIPAEVQQFIQDCITSALHVEVLVLLTENPHADWSATEISARLRSNPSFVSILLAEFQSLGLLWVTDAPAEVDVKPELRYRYQPASRDLARIVEALATAYRERRHTVLSAIYNPQEPDPLQAFSDAFSFTRKKPREEGE